MTPFTTRNDPLVAAAKKALETGAQRRAVQKEVLEEMGGTHLRGMTNENRAKYTDEVNKRVAGPDKLDESKKKVDLVSEAETKPNRGHNSPYDRGSADAHYGRKHNPHYYKDVLGDDGKIVRRDQIKADGMHPHEIEEYTKGYQGADDFGDGKRLRHVEKAKPKNVNDVYREHVEVVAEAPVEGKHFIKTKDLSKDKTNKESDKRIQAVAKNEKKQVNEVSDSTKQSYLKKAGKWLDKFKKAPAFEVSQKDMQREPKRVETVNKLNKKVVKEEQLDELSKDTLRSYQKKASRDKEGLDGAIDQIYGKYGKEDGESKLPASLGFYKGKLKKRNKGLEMVDDKLIGEGVSIEEIMAEIKANGIDVDKILEGRATGVPMIARSPQQTPVPAAERRPIGLQKGPSLAQRNQSSTNATPVGERRPIGQTLNGPRQTNSVMSNNATPTVAPATQSSQGFDEKGFEGVGDTVRTATPPAATMQPPRRTATVAPAKDPTDTAENRRFKQTYAADRTLNRNPNDRFAPDGM